MFYTIVHMSPENEPKPSSNFIAKAKYIGRQVLGAVTGIGIFAGLTYLGYRIGTEVVPTGDETSNVGVALDYAAEAVPVCALGAIGFFGAVAIAPGIAGEKPSYNQ